ncbi:hypothetical protein NGM10_12330 [Halorussus salilacus]|uniref:hypothetical protein n=1 Tax=Halorussus salilacus TaxID=2953750 RepID=UPI0020A01B2F|nr:hypothetical protein [Halorussus salilacus]USZ67512.1 hypothetical protein NGM10_12330 [Halorussus salilacus]
MVSRQNKVVVGFALAALALSLGGSAFTDLSSEALLGILLLGGVVAPVIVNDLLDDRDATRDE